MGKHKDGKGPTERVVEHQDNKNAAHYQLVHISFSHHLTPSWHEVCGGGVCLNVRVT